MTTVQLRSGSGSDTIKANSQAYRKPTPTTNSVSISSQNPPTHSIFQLPTSCQSLNFMDSIVTFATTSTAAKKRLPLIKTPELLHLVQTPRDPPQIPPQNLKASQNPHIFGSSSLFKNCPPSQVHNYPPSAARTWLSVSNLVHLLSCPLYPWT